MRAVRFGLGLAGTVLLGLVPTMGMAAPSWLEAADEREALRGADVGGGVQVSQIAREASGPERPPIEHRDETTFRLDEGLLRYASEGACVGSEPACGTAFGIVDDVKVRLTLDEYPFVAGEPRWITTKVKNEGDTPIRYVTSTCDVPFGVRGVMVGETWRPGARADVEAIEASGRSRFDDLRWRIQEGTYAGDETIRLGFAPKGALGPEE